MVYIFIGLGVMFAFINTVAKHAQKEPSVMGALAKDGKEILQKLNIIDTPDTKEK